MMNFNQQLLTLINGLKNLETNKKIGLAAAFLLLVVGVVSMGLVASTPATVMLYANVEREDLNRMSRILSENGMDFVINNDKELIKVTPVNLAAARMLLAENGLPSGAKSGYELFDKVNSLGLTSFMQDVTNKRAIEGELARTIGMIRGVHSSRVHLVMPKNRGFRRNSKDTATASVVLKTYGTLPQKTTVAIQHMVAAAVRGLESNNVAIIGTDGVLLQSLGNRFAAGSNNLIELESNYSLNIQNKIAAAIGPHLGIDNFRVTVTAKLNSDKRRVDETVFDPDSRVERSVQVVRENGSTENKSASDPTSITQNLPDEPEAAKSGQSSLENSEKREELTNYEINKKKISVVSDGYKIEKLAVTLVVNRDRILAILGANPTEADINKKIVDLETIVKSAAALSDERGDMIKVSLVKFLPGELAPAGQTDGSPVGFLNTHFGSIINAVGLVLGMLVLSLMGIRPLVGLLSQKQIDLANPEGLLEAESQNVVAGKQTDPSLEGPTETAVTSDDQQLDAPESLSMAGVEERETKLREQLVEIVEENDERAAYVFKQWLQGSAVKPA